MRLKALPIPSRALARGTASLLRWLGPWSNGHAPRTATREAHEFSGIRSWLYAPKRAPTGAYLVVPGIHPDGPDDARFDRLCRALADAGSIVLAPSLAKQRELLIAEENAAQVTEALGELARLARGLPPPAIFTISFGSLPGIVTASRAPTSGLVLFGGYASFRRSIVFALTGRAERHGDRLSLKHDPLNAPAVFKNLLPLLDVGADGPILARAWDEMVAATWGKDELKVGDARRPIAERIAAGLPERWRELFVRGCGLVPNDEYLAALFARPDVERAFAFAEPESAIRTLTTPVVIVHGRDDDVIPCLEAEAIAELLPASTHREVLLTGFYGHTGAEKPHPRALAREARTLVRLARAVAAAPLGLLK